MAARRRLAAVAAACVLATACAGVDDASIVSLTATPIGQTVASDVAPTPSASPSTAPSASPSEAASPEPRDPTDTDRARFVSAYQPEGAQDLEHVAVDVDRDGIEEVVVAYSLSGHSRVDIAWWDGFAAYAVGYAGTGGTATRIERLRVSDIQADGRIELVAFESATGDQASLTVWQVVAAGEVTPLRAVDGCASGSATYGVIGATLEDRDGDGSFEIYATCDESPLPRSAWSSHRYIWRDGAYRYAPAFG